jgi:fructosamine-3-kinase
VISQGIRAGRAFLVLERLTLDGPHDWRGLAAMLAQVHRCEGDRYGWHRDNYIGPTPQANGACDDWVRFWRERRLVPQLELAARRGFSVDCGFLLDGLEALLGHRPAPSLLHGDLWSGNAGFDRGEPVIYDPAVYYGDREADLAMTELFGGFPGEFYAAYEEALALPEEYARRKHVYNLYHLLNHLNLFGGGYLGQVQSTLGLLRRIL